MLLQNLRAKIGARLNAKSEEGFTLIELLVVMLILGILAAIALPAFFNQQDKAGDAEAKTIARTAQTAMETYSTDNGGTYDEVDEDALIEIEDTLSGPVDDEILEVTGDENEYTIFVEAPDSGNTFEIVRTADGGLEFPCDTEGEGGCPMEGWG